MRSVKLFAIILIVLGSIGLRWGNRSNAVFTEVCLSSTTIDLGHVLEGEHEVAFVLHNQSQNSIFVDSVAVSCGCSKVEISKDVLLSGDSHSGVVQFSSIGRSGQFRIYYKLLCCEHGRTKANEKSTWEVEGCVQSHIIPLWKPSKDAIVFRATGFDEYSHAFAPVELSVISVGFKELHLINAKVADDSDFFVEVNPETNAIVVHARSSARPGARAELEILTSCVARPGIVLPVSVE